MAHGGHVGGSFGGGARYRHYYHNNNDDDERKEPRWKEILETILLIFFAIFGLYSCATELISVPKHALEGEYSTYHSYLVDNCNYFSNSNDLIAGLKSFHEKSNIQIVVITSNKDWSDSKAVSEYYKMFDDEAHILIIRPNKGSTVYYAIGDLADTVFSDNDMEDLLEYNVRSSNDGEVWEKALQEAAEQFEQSE